MLCGGCAAIEALAHHPGVSDRGGNVCAGSIASGWPPSGHGIDLDAAVFVRNAAVVALHGVLYGSSGLNC